MAPTAVMRLASIPFPRMDPVALHFGDGFGVRWYALAYVVGIALGWWGAARAIRQKSLWGPPPFNGRPPLTEEQAGDLMVWATVIGIAGGRLGWILIYGTILCTVTPDYAAYCAGLPQGFLTNPLRIIAVWQGGMSFHGGLIGVVLALWLYCRRQKLDFLSVADLTCLYGPVTIFLVRIGNFVNGELWGRVTTVPWGMVFPGAGPFPRHPSQLYEAALEGILLFAILQIALRVFHAHRRPGTIAALFLLGYGTFRFICEFFREPDTQFIGPITMGMTLSIAVWAGAALLFWISEKKLSRSRLAAR